MKVNLKKPVCYFLCASDVKESHDNLEISMNWLKRRIISTCKYVHANEE